VKNIEFIPTLDKKSHFPVLFAVQLGPLGFTVLTVAIVTLAVHYEMEMPWYEMALLCVFSVSVSYGLGALVGLTGDGRIDGRGSVPPSTPHPSINQTPSYEEKPCIVVTCCDPPPAGQNMAFPASTLAQVIIGFTNPGRVSTNIVGAAISGAGEPCVPLF
jgi:hypothetical protein